MESVWLQLAGYLWWRSTLVPACNLHSFIRETKLVYFFGVWLLAGWGLWHAESTWPLQQWRHGALGLQLVPCGFLQDAV